VSRAKRLLDVVGAGAGLLLLWPAFVVCAILIMLDDGRPVLFRQTRIGQYGVPFRMWKFRTMVVHAERLGGALTVGRDPRVTRIGHLLRTSKIDELPQLLNVLAGDMSLVGPRPEVAKYVALYDDGQRKVLDLRPGITDPASLKFRDESTLLAQAADPESFYIGTLMPEKIRLNLQYAARASLSTDVAVIGRTILHLFHRRRENVA
jgi:lipopolysaccharide/colanic/teichoic acid biosynthesis glycosyltransferase